MRLSQKGTWKRGKCTIIYLFKAKNFEFDVLERKRNKETPFLNCFASHIWVHA